MVKQRSTVLLQFVEMQLIVVQDEEEEDEDDCEHQEWETIIMGINDDAMDLHAVARKSDAKLLSGRHRDFTFHLEGGSYLVKCTFHVYGMRWQDNIVNGRYPSNSTQMPILFAN